MITGTCNACPQVLWRSRRPTTPLTMRWAWDTNCPSSPSLTTKAISAAMLASSSVCAGMMAYPRQNISGCAPTVSELFHLGIGSTPVRRCWRGYRNSVFTRRLKTTRWWCQYAGISKDFKIKFTYIYSLTSTHSHLLTHIYSLTSTHLHLLTYIYSLMSFNFTCTLTYVRLPMYFH